MLDQNPRGFSTSQEFSLNTPNTLNHSQEVTTPVAGVETLGGCSEILGKHPVGFDPSKQKSSSGAKNSSGGRSASRERGGSSNTPLYSQEETPQSCPMQGLSVRVDFIQCMGHVPNVQPLMDFVQSFTKEGWDVKNTTFSLNDQMKFDYVAKTPRCIKLAWTEVGCELAKEKLYSYWLSIPGKIWADLKLMDQYRLIQGLFFTYSAHGTRFDIALDDYKRRVSPKSVERAVEKGDYAYFRKWKKVVNGGKNLLPVTTIYMGCGNRGIRKKGLVFYNAEAVHGIDADRWELRYRQEYARAMFDGFARANFSEIHKLRFDAKDMDQETVKLAENELARSLAQMVVGSVDFLKRSKKGSDKREKNLDRCKRYRWWQSLRNDVGAMKTIIVTRPKPTLEGTIKWIERQVMVSMTMLRDGWGYMSFQSWFLGQMEKARERYDDMNKLTIELIRCREA